MIGAEEDQSHYESVGALLGDKRYRDAFERCRTYAQEGSVSCKNLLAWMYQNGIGVSPDLDRARELFVSTANTGSLVGKFYLGKLESVGGRYEEALRWFEQAAQEDYAPAIYRLGRAHKLGRGVPVDRTKARSLFERASRLGHLFARREVALDMIKGSYGFAQIPKGLIEFASTVWTGARIASHDFRDDRLTT